ncbi:MAG: (d)CMP kinase [Melioribacteraceae bacterium]|nr:(d)CMP kinase [Melioribacteraceae bacterium]MCO6474538.1 (d)CMP kinase [Melioribacteraceae bacterium]MDD3557417.1 (d)CMP kinase [Melioribacteraceae bacterium]
MSKNLVIAIDGPAGSGKSTIAKYLAQKLNAVYVDTGAMYRAITFLALRNDIADNTPEVINLVRDLDIKLRFEFGITRVFVNDEEVTHNIRTKEVNDKVSDISRIPEVREELVKIQKKLGENQTIVAEGRDTTTVVFPEADFKIFLTADLDVRAERRFKEFLEKGTEIDLDAVKSNLAERDRIDSSRKVSPLKKAEDAFELDSTSLTIKEELDMLLEKIKSLKETEPQ